MTTPFKNPSLSSNVIGWGIVIAGVWFAVAAALGLSHTLANTNNALIAPVAWSVIVPIVIFTVLYNSSAWFHQFVLDQDITTLTMLQFWRIIGFTFLPLTFYGVLPPLFGYPAGFGDVAMGLLAPLVVFWLIRNPHLVTSNRLVGFHLLGLLDFVTAIGTSILASDLFPGLVAGGLTSAAMDVWPLNLFPSFIVPAFIMVHLTVLLKVRHLRKAAHAGSEIAGVAHGAAR